MSLSVEECLRRALGQQAETTTVAPDAWRRIRGRLDHDRRWRPSGFRQWLLLAPAVGVAVVAVIIVAVLAGRDGDSRLQVAGRGESRLYLAPTGVEPRFHLEGADTDPQTTPLPPGTFRAFGRRAADGVALAASVVVTTPADFALGGQNPPTRSLRVLDRDVAVADDRFGLEIPTWTQGDGRTVAVMTFGLSEAQLIAVVASLLPADATTAVPALPPGFTPVRSGALPEGRPSVSFQNWAAEDDTRFGVSVADSPVSTVDDLAWWVPGGRVTKVRGKTAIYTDRSDRLLTWLERPGVSVTVVGEGLSEKEMVAIAEGLRPIDEAAWRQLTLRAPPKSGEIVNVPATEGFRMQPVSARSAPPCPPAMPQVLPERRGGQDVACYQLGPPLVTAHDVATAVAQPDATTGTWAVEYRLTPEGAGRLDAMLRSVGVGGQVAIVVDGVVVSAIRVETTSGNGRGVIAGLDEQTARRLAERLPR